MGAGANFQAMEVSVPPDGIPSLGVLGRLIVCRANHATRPFALKRKTLEGTNLRWSEDRGHPAASTSRETASILRIHSAGIACARRRTRCVPEARMPWHSGSRRTQNEF
jgi:hypothetical protein